MGRNKGINNSCPPRDPVRYKPRGASASPAWAPTDMGQANPPVGEPGRTSHSEGSGPSVPCLGVATPLRKVGESRCVPTTSSDPASCLEETENHFVLTLLCL